MPHLYELNEEMYTRMKRNLTVLVNNIQYFFQVLIKHVHVSVFLCMCETQRHIVMKTGYQTAYILLTAECLHLLFSSFVTYFPTKYTEKISYPTLFVL